MQGADTCVGLGRCCTLLSCCGGRLRESLRAQDELTTLLTGVSERVAGLPGRDRTDAARRELARLNKRLPACFPLVLDPRVVCCRLSPDRCKVMRSKKAPLWLVFENADKHGKDVCCIFKTGDDLRQDVVTLQLLQVMDTLWTEKGLDMRMLTYRCVPVGDRAGWIEVVPDALTTAKIQKEQGGQIIGALRNFSIQRHLKQSCRSGDELVQAINCFTRSCAGYCVATYVLGVGDRHPDNVMVTSKGHLFHIDFGHFLGNFKSKFGILRERAPFLFTPEMAYVMGHKTTARGGGSAKHYALFKQQCCQAYNVIRENADELMGVIVLMLPAGMAELQDREAISYVRDMLSPEMTAPQAAEKFRQEIESSLRSVSRRFDNAIHNIRN